MRLICHAGQPQAINPLLLTTTDLSGTIRAMKGRIGTNSSLIYSDFYSPTKKRGNKKRPWEKKQYHSRRESIRGTIDLSTPTLRDKARELLGEEEYKKLVLSLL